MGFSKNDGLAKQSIRCCLAVDECSQPCRPDEAARDLSADGP